jgi:hypothetical protein
MQPGPSLAEPVPSLGSVAAGAPKVVLQHWHGAGAMPLRAKPAYSIQLPGAYCLAVAVIVSRSSCTGTPLPAASVMQVRYMQRVGVLSGGMLPQGAFVPVQHRDVAAVTGGNCLDSWCVVLRERSVCTLPAVVPFCSVLSCHASSSSLYADTVPC